MEAARLAGAEVDRAGHRHDGHWLVEQRREGGLSAGRVAAHALCDHSARGILIDRPRPDAVSLQLLRQLDRLHEPPAARDEPHGLAALETDESPLSAGADEGGAVTGAVAQQW